MTHDEITRNLLLSADDPFSLLSDEMRVWVKEIVANNERMKAELEAAAAEAQRLRADVIEQAAQVAEAFDGPGHIFARDLAQDLPTGWAGCRREIAAAIRALSNQQEGTK